MGGFMAAPASLKGMQVHVAVSGRRLGPFDLTALRAEIESGRIQTKGALAWWDGCTGWQPLEAVPGLATGSLGIAPPTERMVLPAVPEGDSTGGIIPYKNGPALVAYYGGILSLLPALGLIAGIVAVAAGVQGLRKRRAEPWVRGSVHAWIGIVVGSLSVLVHLLLIAAMLVARSR